MRTSFRAFLHITPVQLRSGQIDDNLRDLLSGLIRRDKKSVRRIWRSLWWFNSAHQDHPYERVENSILSLATAFEALLRPQPLIKGQSKSQAFAATIAVALGTDDLNYWAEAFYRSRSQIVHGDEDWSPMFGAPGHVSHYRVARETFQAVVEKRVALEFTPPGTPAGQLQVELIAAMRTRSLTRLVVANSALISRLVPHSFASLQLRRNARVAWEISVLPVLLNDEDVGTPRADYERLLDWLRSVAISAARSGAQRWRADAGRFHELRRAFEGGTPTLSSVVTAPAGADFMKALALDRLLPERRAVVGNTTSLTDIAETMEDVAGRIDLAHLREREA